MITDRALVPFFVHASTPHRLSEFSESDMQVYVKAGAINPSALIFLIGEQYIGRAEVINSKISAGKKCLLELTSVKEPASQLFPIENAQQFSDQDTGNMDGLQLLITLTLSDYDALLVQGRIIYRDF